MVHVALACVRGAAGVGKVLVEVLAEVAAPDEVSAEAAMGKRDDVGAFVGEEGEGDDEAFVALAAGDGAFDQALAKEVEDAVVGQAGECHPCEYAQVRFGGSFIDIRSAHVMVGQDRGRKGKRHWAEVGNPGGAGRGKSHATRRAGVGKRHWRTSLVAKLQGACLRCR